MENSRPTHAIPDDALLEILQDCESQGDACVKPFLVIAERNERFTHGDQFQDINPQSNTIEDAWREHLPRTTQNHLRNLVNTWKARITKNRPSVSAWPTNATAEAQASARIAAKLIEYIEKEEQLDLKIDDCARIAAMHGTAGFKIIYNPDSQTVQWHRLSIQDYLIDPTVEGTDQAAWVIFRSYIDQYSAKKILENKGIDQAPQAETYRVNESEDRDGVQVKELWYRPSARLPDGLFLKVVSGHIVDRRPYPYLFQNLENPEATQPESVLPIVTVRVDYKRGYQYGETWLSDAISEQRRINETEAALLAVVRATGNTKLISPTNTLVQQLNSTNQVIVLPEGNQGVGYLPPPQINSLLFSNREYHFKRLYDLAGLNEQLVGVENVGSGTSGRQLAYLAELDAMKHKGTTQSLESMLVRGWKLTLQLVQRYYIDTRIMRISAEWGYDTLSYRGADIQGITVDLEPRPGLERMPQAKATLAQEQAAQGLIAAPEALERQTTGQNETRVQTLTRRLIAEEIRALLQGAVVPADPALDPVQAAAEVDRIAELLGPRLPGPSLDAVRTHAQAYRNLIQQQIGAPNG